MRKIVKLIFRLDFDVNFRVMDQPGKAFECLLSPPEGFWNNIGESVEGRAIRASYSERFLYRNATIDPSTINGVFEILPGVDFEDISENITFNGYSKMVSEFCSVFNIDKINRAGLRIMLFENYGEKFSNPIEKFRGIFNPSFLKSFNSSIGDIKDSGIIFNGVTKDSLNFKINFGGFHNTDIMRFTNTIGNNMDKETFETVSKNHLSADIDLSENDFSFKGLTLKKWAKDKWPVINKFMENCKSHMLNCGDENV